MSERYWITGVQLGCLCALEKYVDREKLVNEIVDKQFMGNVNSPQVVSETVSHGEGSNALQNNQHEAPSADTKEEQIKSELYKGVKPQDGGKNG